jgi:hypothetical protein
MANYMGATDSHGIVARLCAISEQRKTQICDRVVHFKTPEDTTMGRGMPLQTHWNVHTQGDERDDSQRSPSLANRVNVLQKFCFLHYTVTTMLKMHTVRKAELQWKRIANGG